MEKSCIDVDIDSTTGVATILMNRRPMNILNLDLIVQLDNVLEKLQNDKDIRALILASSIENIFCAGLDIKQMYKPSHAKLGSMWSSLQRLWFRLYSSRLPVIAAISGHSPAGGCLLAMSCDYRIMVEGNYVIGLNETKLGLLVSSWFKETMVNVIGFREAEKALQLGTLYTGAQALRVGLVDELVPAHSLKEACAKQAKIWASIPDEARIATKINMRRQTIQNLQDRRQQDVDENVSYLLLENTQENLKRYIDSLNSKSKL